MATKTQLLAEAEAAFHRLMTGTAVVEVRDSNGETVKYNSTTKNSLSIYIQSLRRDLGLIDAGSGPMRVYF